MLGLLAGKPRGTRYADVGAGDLYFAERLCQLSDAPVYAVDANYPAHTVQGQLVICTNLDTIPAASVDCAILMDVLEHVDDDVSLLRTVRRVLASSGQLLVTVPAHSFLWSEHDTFLGHRRRYDRRRLHAAVEQAGFDLVESFSFYGAPYLVRLGQVCLSRLGLRDDRFQGVGHWSYPPVHPVTRMVRAALDWDFRVTRLISSISSVDFGLSLCARCRPSA
jgi:SAM-dependent methyltransferase